MFLPLFNTEPAVHMYRNGNLLPCPKSNSKASGGWTAAASCIWPDELLLGGELEDAASHRTQFIHQKAAIPLPTWTHYCLYWSTRLSFPPLLPSPKELTRSGWAFLGAASFRRGARICKLVASFLAQNAIDVFHLKSRELSVLYKNVF